MTIAAHRLATALVERLKRVVPQPFMLEAIGTNIQLSAAEGFLFVMPCDWFETDDRADAVLLELAAGNLLNCVQDAIARETTKPWPAAQGTMPSYDTRWDGTSLHCWYGPSEQKAVISLAAIPLGSVVSPGR